MTGLEIALRGRPTLAKSPNWDLGSGNLVWVDVLGSAVHRYWPRSDHDDVTPVPQHVGAAEPRTNGGLVLNLRDGIGLFDLVGTPRWLVYWARDGMRGSSAAIDPAGRLWAGTMRYDQAAGGGFLARVDQSGRASIVLPSVTTSSGIGWSPDQTLMYFVDTPTGCVDVFDYDVATGTPTNRRPLCRIATDEGAPDGLCVDTAGCVWVAIDGGGQVRRYTPDGTLDRVVEIPATQVTGCCFGGDDMRDLFVTTGREHFTERQSLEQPLAGSLFLAPDMGEGLLPTRFPG